MNAPAASSASQEPCVNCGQQPGVGRSCRNCLQTKGMPAGVRSSSTGRRFGAHLLDGLLALVTLYIGWMIWSWIVWRGGRTPAKQLLGMRTVKTGDLRPSGWWRMAWREFAKGVVLFIPVFGWVLAFWLMWDDDRQELWDKMAGTIVVDYPKHLPVPSVTPKTGEQASVAARPVTDTW